VVASEDSISLLRKNPRLLEAWVNLETTAVAWRLENYTPRLSDCLYANFFDIFLVRQKLNRHSSYVQSAAAKMFLDPLDGRALTILERESGVSTREILDALPKLEETSGPFWRLDLSKRYELAI